ncbi:hypothetical protein AsAng_0029190 [Aureispira anguillae]|uniref:Uncharacterized protein n=1 Tax=Aureispira anguillae TaxID=2864201 RepID=A0A916DS05_9BACT|nr:hypothetical protein AsAng_0029190 [Aureispira anguillae]
MCDKLWLTNLFQIKQKYKKTMTPPSLTSSYYKQATNT